MFIPDNTTISTAALDTSTAGSIQEKCLTDVSPALKQKIQEVKQRIEEEQRVAAEAKAQEGIFTKVWNYFTSDPRKPAPKTGVETFEETEVLFPNANANNILSIIGGYLNSTPRFDKFLSTVGLPFSLSSSEAKSLSPENPHYAQQAFRELQEKTKKDLLLLHEQGAQEPVLIKKFIAQLRGLGPDLSTTERTKLQKIGSSVRELDISKFKKQGSASAFSQTDWEAILATFSNLQTLIVEEASVTDEDLTYIARFTQLSHLNINKNDSITFSGLLNLKGLPLTKLHIQDVRLTRDELQQFFKIFSAISDLTLSPTADAIYPYPFDDFLLLPALKNLHIAQEVSMQEVAKLRSLHIEGLILHTLDNRIVFEPVLVGCFELRSFKSISHSDDPHAFRPVVNFEKVAALLQLNSLHIKQVWSDDYLRKIELIGLPRFTQSSLKELILEGIAFARFIPDARDRDPWVKLFRSLPAGFESLSLIDSNIDSSDLYGDSREIQNLKKLVIRGKNQFNLFALHDLSPNPSLEVMYLPIGDLHFGNSFRWKYQKSPFGCERSVKRPMEGVKGVLTKKNFPCLREVHFEGAFTDNFTKAQFDELQEQDIEFFHDE